VPWTSPGQMLARHRTWVAGQSAPGDDTNDVTAQKLETSL
jgi:hypothetical protein